MFGTVGALAAQLPSTFPKNFVCTPGSTQRVSQTVSNGDFLDILPGAVHITVATGGTVRFQVTGMPQFGGLTFAARLVINAPIDVSSQVKGPAGGDLVGSIQSSAGTSFTFIVSCSKGGGPPPPPPPPPPPGGSTADNFKAEDGLATIHTIGQSTFSLLNDLTERATEDLKCIVREYASAREKAKLDLADLKLGISNHRRKATSLKNDIDRLQKKHDELEANGVVDISPGEPRDVRDALDEDKKELDKINFEISEMEGKVTALQEMIGVETKVEQPCVPQEKFPTTDQEKQQEKKTKALVTEYTASSNPSGIEAPFDTLLGAGASGDLGSFQFFKRAPLGYADGPIDAPRLSRGAFASRWNMWTSGALNGVDLSGFADSSAFGGRADVGIDYRVSATTLVGAFLGYEGEHLKADFTGGTVDENAFVFGAYTGVRLPQDWVLAIAGGGALNHIVSTIGSDSGSTDGLRGFASASLSRTWRFGPWSLSPTGSIAYASEHQNGYITAAGVVVPAQTVELGRASLGPTLAYHVPTSDPRWQVELISNVALKYDFGTDIALGTTNRFSPDGFGGSIGGGLSISHGGMSGSLSASYDSIGRPGESAWTLHAGLLVRH